MGKQFRLAIISSAAIAAVALARSPLWAQESDVLDAELWRAQQLAPYVRALERDLARAEEARLSGDCERVRETHRAFQNLRGHSAREREIVDDLKRRIQEIALRDCPPGSRTPSISPPPSPPAASPTPGPAMSEPVVAPEPPAVPGTVSSRGTQTPAGPAPDEPESILDEAADDINSTVPDRSASPASGAVPGSAGSVGSQAPVEAPPQAPAGQPRRDILDSLVPLRPALYAAIAGCDREAFQAAKNRLLEAIGQLLTRYPGNIHLLAERRRIEETQFPQPCPPDVPLTGNPEGVRYPWQDEEVGIAVGVEYRRENLSVSSDIMLGFSEVPQTGIGVRREGASGASPETDTALSDGTVPTLGIGVNLEARGYNLRAGYSVGDAATSFQVDPVSGGFNGQVFGGLSPAGSSGIGAGSASQTGTTETEVSQFRLGGDLFVAQPTPQTRIFIAADYIRDQRTYLSSITGTVGSSSSVITFTQERDQRITDNAFGLGVGGEWHLPLRPRPDARTTLLIRAVTQVFLLDSQLRSTERNRSNFGPSSDRDFTLQFDENETEFGIAISGRAELDHQIAPGVSIFVGGAVDYRSRVSGLFNPNSGDQVFFEGRTTELISDDSWSYGGRIGLKVRIR